MRIADSCCWYCFPALLLFPADSVHNSVCFELHVPDHSCQCVFCLCCSTDWDAGLLPDAVEHTFCRSARDTSNTRPFRPSEAICTRNSKAASELNTCQGTGQWTAGRQVLPNQGALPCPYLGTLRPGHQCLADIANGKHGWSLHIIPVLLGEGINAAKTKKQV